ncbi:hypothetical protein [Chryseobacterium sp. 2987]|uniref:hypothetical protein n=1 Tax=Chryseobacterium sp. 2987 TaxID=2817767 RepID=UPI002863390B|nr:hypothetical protein [Chryseobacterium sp. 2987]MDR6919536.1 hypothetical protein [Chryseobacterium sp. 2987]
MGNAKTDFVGNDRNSRKRNRDKTVPQIGELRRLDEKTKGRTGNSKGQKKVCASNHVTDDFLRTSFLPKLKGNNLTQISGKSAKLERDFFKSLSGLAEHYSIEIESVDNDKFEFPYNINLALAETKQLLKKTVATWGKIQLINEGKKAYLVVEERYYTGNTLFYIPVLPLFRMLKDKKHHKNAQLILSVFSYLYHIADIPYYRQEASYLYWEYEMLKDWVLDDVYFQEDDEEDHRIDEIGIAEWVGSNMEKKIRNKNNLTFFDDRINKFKPKNQFDENCLLIARNAISIYHTYPQTDIFRNASSILDDTGEEIDEQIIPMERYISFYADNDGWLADTLFETVNNQFQEYGEMQEPVIFKHFDGRDIQGMDLAFEHLLFDLMHDLIDVLNDYKKLNL